MCCWPYRVVYLEEPPKPPKKKPEEKKDREFVLVSSDFNVQLVQDPEQRSAKAKIPQSAGQPSRRRTVNSKNVQPHAWDDSRGENPWMSGGLDQWLDNSWDSPQSSDTWKSATHHQSTTNKAWITPNGDDGWAPDPHSRRKKETWDTCKDDHGWETPAHHKPGKEDWAVNYDAGDWETATHHQPGNQSWDASHDDHGWNAFRDDHRWKAFHDDHRWGSATHHQHSNKTWTTNDTDDTTKKGTWESPHHDESWTSATKFQTLRDDWGSTHADDGWGSSAQPKPKKSDWDAPHVSTRAKHNHGMSKDAWESPGTSKKTRAKPAARETFTSGDPMVYTSTLRAPEASHGNATKKGSKGKGDSIWANGADEELEFVPEVPTGNTQYYCQETSGVWKLRTTNDIMNHCQPGDWRVHPDSGYPYFVRKTA